MNKPFKANLTTLLLVGALAIPFSAYGVDGQIKLTQPVAPDTFPIVINRAGSYILTSNLVVTDPDINAITIEVNDVTLDLNGHKIQGPNPDPGQGTGVGIYSENSTITLKNGRVWGFASGVWIAGIPTANIGAGIIAKELHVANNNNWGIYINGGLLLNCTVNNNTLHGIAVGFSTVTNCTANHNGGTGLAISKSTVTNCTVTHNGYGINSSGSSTVSNCTVSYNSQGMKLLSSTLVKGCNVRNNDNYGILFDLPPTGEPTNYIYGNAIGQNGVAFSCPTGNVCTDNAIW